MISLSSRVLKMTDSGSGKTGDDGTFGVSGAATLRGNLRGLSSCLSTMVSPWFLMTIRRMSGVFAGDSWASASPASAPLRFPLEVSTSRTNLSRVRKGFPGLPALLVEEPRLRLTGRCESCDFGDVMASDFRLGLRLLPNEDSGVRGGGMLPCDERRSGSDSNSGPNRFFISAFPMIFLTRFGCPLGVSRSGLLLPTEDDCNGGKCTGGCSLSSRRRPFPKA